MSFASVWRGWRARVHDILEVGDGNPIGRVVNVFLIVLIIANGLAFVAETVSSVYERWGPELEAFNIFSVIVFTVEYVLRLWSSVEIPLYHPHAALARAAELRASADDDHRPFSPSCPFISTCSCLLTCAPCGSCASSVCSACSSCYAIRQRS